MRKITELVCGAFESGRIAKMGNSETDGEVLRLHGNRIAWQGEGGLWISNCGWQSNTTKERLNGLAGVSINQVKGQWFLNGKEWNGAPVCVDKF